MTLLWGFSIGIVITELWARRYDVKKKRYEYKVLWAGCPAFEASFVAEGQIDAKELADVFGLSDAWLRNAPVQVQRVGLPCLV